MIEIADDPWLAAILSRPVHRVTGYVGTDDALSVRRLREVTARPAFSYSRLATADTRSLDAFEAAGFRVVDTSVTLETEELPEPAAQGDVVRLATPDDASAVERVARASFTLSRFHLDPRIDSAVADEIKARWAANFFHGRRGDHMVVAQREGELAGFVQLLVAPDGLLIIDLIAVAASHRRRGLAGAMIRFAAHTCGRVTRLRVGTQASNVESLRMYQKLGFLVTGTAYVVHCHGPVRS